MRRYRQTERRKGGETDMSLFATLQTRLNLTLRYILLNIFQPRHSFLKSSLPIRTSALYAFLIKLSRAAYPAHLIILNFVQGQYSVKIITANIHYAFLELRGFIKILLHLGSRRTPFPNIINIACLLYNKRHK
jgi:hypothetical protein